MSRRAARRTGALPPPLPPERRTVGQLVAETIRSYSSLFLRVLPIGLVVAVVNQLTVDRGRVATGVVLLAAAPVFTLAFAYACRLVAGRPAPPRSWVTAVAVGTVVFLPAALLFPWFALAAVLWLALAGLCVPAAMLEGAAFTESLRRGITLGRAGYVHAAGSLATLVLLFVLARFGLALLLESQADETVRTAIFLADVVLSPLLFLGGAQLYGDQAARRRAARATTAPA